MVSNNEVQKKMRLEKIFSRELKPTFGQILRDFRVHVAAFGVSQDAEQYEPSFNGLLRSAYSRTQRAFTGDVAEDNQLSLDQDDGTARSLYSIALLEWKTTNANQKAEIITDTNQKQMDKSIITARGVLSENEEPETPLTLAATATAILRRQLNVRNDVIAQTETQEAAESTKLIEAQVLAGGKPFNLQSIIVPSQVERKEVSKTWSTFRDSRVRPTHIAVEGVTIKENALFVVGDSRLLFPGDTSHFPDIAEIIRCRCSSSYNITDL